MVREVVVHRDAAHSPSVLHAPVYALNRFNDAAMVSVLNPTAAPTAMAPSALRTL